MFTYNYNWSGENINHSFNLGKKYLFSKPNLSYQYNIFVFMKPKTDDKDSGFLDRHIIGLLLQKDYWNVFYCFGIEPLLRYLKQLEKEERYEDCQRIMEVINWHNEQTGDNTPTKLEDL